MTAERRLAVDAAGVRLDGDLAVPAGAQGVVVFAHGSGSGRRSPRNRRVAAALQDARLATLLFDLLTPEEGVRDERTAELRFAVDLLADRLTGAVDWTASVPELAALPVGCFGASTGAAAALAAAARRPDRVAAVVSRGGRPDLAASVLDRVRAPVLLVVGGEDREVLELNRQARDLLPGDAVVEVVEGATHLFEEPGALEQVERLAIGWFTRHLAAAGAQ